MLIKQNRQSILMSDPSIIELAREHHRKSTSIERDWWNSATPEARESILNEVNYTDLSASYHETAFEAYQQDYLAKNYDALPQTIKDIIYESLKTNGELPNPTLHEGFVYNVGNSTMVECDRCDESFTNEADFSEHKAVDHGDEKEDFSKVEETFTLSMNPNLTRESLREARRLLVETEQKTLGDLYFNGGHIKTSKLTVPKATPSQGYNDNPNEGLYDTKKFKDAPSTKRHDGLESLVLEGYEDDMADAKHEGLSDITHVPERTQKETEPNALEGVDFGEENVEYVYPTKPETAQESVGDPQLRSIAHEYGGAVESDQEAITNQVIDRKLRGFGAEAIARELEIQTGVSHDEALETIYGIEVSTNDRVANTFFGKRFADCTEAEKAQLRVFSGSDE